MIDFTIIIPVYNESQNIQPLVDKINRLELNIILIFFLLMIAVLMIHGK